MTLFLLVVLLLFFAAYIISPFFEKDFSRKRITTDGEGREELMSKKEEILAAISDLEYDYKMRKMADADYQQLKEKLTAEAIEVMKKLDTLEGRKHETAGIATRSHGAGRKVRS